MRNQVVSHEDWLKARLELLAAENPKAAMRTASTSRWSGSAGTISIEALRRCTRRWKRSIAS